MSRDPDDRLRDAWAAQTVEAARPDPAALDGSVLAFEQIVGRRNQRELFAGAVVVLAFGALAWIVPDPLGQVACGLIAAGALSVMVTLLRRGRTAPRPEELAGPCLDWRRRELTRERDLLAGVWWWYLGPLVPGFVLFVLSGALRADTTGQLAIQGLVLGMGALVFVWIGRLNATAARALDEELRALDEVSDAG